MVLNTLNIVVVLLLLIITICGISAFNTSYSYEVVNQYGESIRMWGAGIYAHDSYFKASIFIGSDFTILIFVVPLTIITLKKMSLFTFVCLVIQQYNYTFYELRMQLENQVVQFHFSSSHQRTKVILILLVMW